MPNLLDRGIATSKRCLPLAGGRTVTYRRPGVGSVSIVATPNEKEERVVGSDGIATEIRVYSWTITAAELVIGGKVIEPRPGDYIEETLQGAPVKWQVAPFAEDKKCFDWLDTSHILLSVHSQQVQ